MAMNVSGATDPALQALQSVDQTDSMRAKLQVALLKKTLQSQQDQAAEIRQLMEGKGRVVDLRV